MSNNPIIHSVIVIIYNILCYIIIYAVQRFFLTLQKTKINNKLMGVKNGDTSITAQYIGNKNCSV